MNFSNWLKSTASKLELSPASMYQLGEGLAQITHKPVMPAEVAPAQNPYTDDPRRQAINQLQMQNNAEEVAMQQAQAKLVLAENVRDSVKKAREINQFRSSQAMSYVGSGVQLQGTPLLVLEETRQLGQQEIDAATQAAIARADLMRRRANIMANEGNARMLSADLAYSTARNEFDIREGTNATLSKIGRNTGYDSKSDIWKALGGLLPMWNGTARVNRTKKDPITPPVPVPAPIIPPVVPDPISDPYVPPLKKAKLP